MTTFGASAKPDSLFAEFGLTVDALLKALEIRNEKGAVGKISRREKPAGLSHPFAGRHHEEIAALEKASSTTHRILERIWQKDYRVWSEDPTEISNRLGWLDSPEISAALADEIIDFVACRKKRTVTNALLLGMGGSSLARKCSAAAFGARTGYLDLEVLTAPIPRRCWRWPKAGSGKNTLHCFHEIGRNSRNFFLHEVLFQSTTCQNRQENAGRHFIAITDPGSGLESAAGELSFRKIFLTIPRSAAGTRRCRSSASFRRRCSASTSRNS